MKAKNFDGSHCYMLVVVRRLCGRS